MIRPMLPTDQDRILKIYAQSLSAGDATFTKDLPTWEKWDADHHQDCRLVYERGGQVLGFAVLSPTSTKAHFRGVVEDSVYVDRAHRGEGIGLALLRSLCTAAEEAGYWTIYSSIFPENLGSMAIHEKCGFRIIGTREKIARDIFGTWRDTVILEKRSAKVF